MPTRTKQMPPHRGEQSILFHETDIQIKIHYDGATHFHLLSPLQILWLGNNHL